MTEPSPFKDLDECFAAVVKSRDAILAFYDVRHAYASYLEIVGSIGAAMIKNNIYTRQEVAHRMADTLADTLTRDSGAQCLRRFGKTAIEGGKQ